METGSHNQSTNMDEKSRGARAHHRSTKLERRKKNWAEQARNPFSSIFTIRDDEDGNPPELQEYLVRHHLGKGISHQRMTSRDVSSALKYFTLSELNQLWGMREIKLKYVEDAALLLAHIRFRSGIDAQLRPAVDLLDYEVIQSLQGVLEESGRLTVNKPLPPNSGSPAAEGKRIEQVLRVIREGQTEFRRRLVAHYGAVCMVTGTAHAGVIDAAHIVPYNGASTNALSNGLLLRKDIHALFDSGLLNIGPDLVIYMGEGVNDPFYRSLDGKQLTLSSQAKMSREALRKRLTRVAACEVEYSDSIPLP